MHICLLDIDGTLVLTGGAGQTAFAQTLADDFGIREVNMRVAFAGRSDRAIAMELFRHHGVEESPENWRRFCTGYLLRLDAALASHRGIVLPGATELLAALSRRGDVALGLLTGNIREGAKRKLIYYGLWNWFAFGGYGDDHLERCHIAAAALAQAHQHIAGLRSGAAQLGLSFTGKLLVIGDTPSDIDCGRSIGAHCVAVPTGFSTPDDLRSRCPDLLVDTLENIEPIVALLDT
jgi:phosphoglycolate phosphatase-like HAD superfamily hydrolase